jgi:hypothetical protein
MDQVPGTNTGFLKINGLADIFTALKNVVIAINAIATAIQNSFPQATGTATSATAGSITPPGQVKGYITITLPDGSPGKVPYYGA